MKRIKRLSHIPTLILQAVCCVLLGLALFPQKGQAQHALQFIEIPPIAADNDSARHFSLSVNLGYQSQRDSFDVRIVFPEYRTLSRDEANRLMQKGFQFPSTLTYTTQQATWKKQAIVTLDIIPYVQQDKQYRQLVSFKIDTLRKSSGSPTFVQARSTTRSQVSLASLSTPQRYAKNSVLSSGKWVKIRVAESGIYQMSADWLKSAGFNDISKVKLYGYGGLMQDSILGDNMIDDLSEVPLYRRNGNVLFYAEGTRTYIHKSSGALQRHINNPYSAYSYYFLTEGENPMEWPTTTGASQAPSDTVDYVRSYVINEYDSYSWYHGGRQFYDSYDFATNNSRSIHIELPGFYQACTDEKPSVAMATSSTQSCMVNLTLNGENAGSFSIPALGSQYTSANEKGYYLTAQPQRSNTLNIRTTAGVAARLNFICVPYLRTLSVTDGALPFSTAATGTTLCYSVQNANSNTRIWHIGRGTTTGEVPGQLNGSNYRANLLQDGERYIALDITATYDSPELVGNVTNQDLHADSAYQMVIIIPTSGKLYDQAKRLADFHEQHDGLRIKIVKASELYNEFSSGTPDATAYRRYMKMLYDKATTEAEMPKYLLLFGDCVWDNRMITEDWKGASPDDYLLAYESDYSLGTLYNYTTDDYFGLLDDGEGAKIVNEKIDLGIGRFTVSTPEEAKIMVDKVIAYAQNTTYGNWQNTICFMADDGDANLHMTDAESVISNNQTYLQNFNVKKIYWDAYNRTATATGNSYPQAQADIKTVLQNGALIMNYSGHGSPAQLSVEKVMVTSDFGYTTDKLPLWIMASCEIDPYDDPNDMNIGRTAVLNAHGGAIGMICAARTVVSDKNNYLNRTLTQALLKPQADGSATTLGEALMTTKNSLVTSGMDRTDNKLRYVLIGDPALRLNVPTARIVIDSINGQSVKQRVQLKAGQTATICGYITNANGDKLENWDGMVSTTLFDIEQTVTCKNNDNSASTNYVYRTWSKSLFDGSDSIRNGKIRVEIPIPIDISYSNNSGKLVMYAINTDRTQEANGNTTQLFMNGTSTDLTTDTVGPKVYIYLNHPDFSNGGLVGNEATFYATLSDSSGINNTGNGVGHDIELCIDNDENMTYVLNSYFQYDFGKYTSGSITYPLSGLPDGNHTLTLRVWDLQNNPSVTTLDFIVTQTWNPSVYVSAQTADNTVTFNISIDGQQLQQETPYTIKVYDLQGHNLWNGDGTLQATNYGTHNWNLCASYGGAPVSSGLYICYVEALINGKKVKSRIEKIIVHRQ